MKDTIIQNDITARRAVTILEPTLPDSNNCKAPQFSNANKVEILILLRITSSSREKRINFRYLW